MRMVNTFVVDVVTLLIGLADVLWLLGGVKKYIFGTRYGTALFDMLVLFRNIINKI